MALSSLNGTVDPVQYSSPRAVRVNDDAGEARDAVYGSFAIYSSTKTATDALIAEWPAIMALVAEKASQVIASVTPIPPPE